MFVALWVAEWFLFCVYQFMLYHVLEIFGHNLWAAEWRYLFLLREFIHVVSFPRNFSVTVCATVRYFFFCFPNYNNSCIPHPCYIWSSWSVYLMCVLIHVLSDHFVLEFLVTLCAAEWQIKSVEFSQIF